MKVTAHTVQFAGFLHHSLHPISRVRNAALILLLLLQWVIFAFGTSVITHIGKNREWKAAFRAHRTNPSPQTEAALDLEHEKGRPKEYVATAIFGLLFLANGYLIFRVLRGKHRSVTQTQPIEV